MQLAARISFSSGRYQKQAAFPLISRQSRTPAPLCRLASVPQVVRSLASSSSSGKTFERKPTSKSAAAGASTNQSSVNQTPGRAIKEAQAAAAAAAASVSASRGPAAKAPRTPTSRAPVAASSGTSGGAPTARVTRGSVSPVSEIPDLPPPPPELDMAAFAKQITPEQMAEHMPAVRAELQKDGMSEKEINELVKYDPQKQPEEEEEEEDSDLTEAEKVMPTPETVEVNRAPVPTTIPAWKPMTTQDFLLESIVRKPTIHGKAALLKTLAEHAAFMIVALEPEQYQKAKESANPDGSAELSEDSGVSFHSYSTVMKTDVIPLFTAKHRAIGYWERCDFDDQEDKITLAEVEGFDVFATAAESQTAVFVNPYSPVAAVIPAEACKHIVEGNLEAAAKLVSAARLPEPMVLRDSSAASVSPPELTETQEAQTWRKKLSEAVHQGMSAGLQDMAAIRQVGLRMEKLQHTQLLHPGTPKVQYVLECVVDPPGAETETERKMREEFEKSGQEIPLTREELYESSVVSSLSTIVEAQDAPPAGIALYVTPVKQLSDESLLVFRRSAASVAAPKLAKPAL